MQSVSFSGFNSNSKPLIKNKDIEPNERKDKQQVKMTKYMINMNKTAFSKLKLRLHLFIKIIQNCQDVITIKTTIMMIKPRLLPEFHF